MAKSRSTSGSARGADRPRPAAADGAHDPAPAPPVRDVWSRSGAKYRRRAIVLLLVNVLLFAAVGSFAFWLRTGHHFAPAVDNYWSLFGKTFQPMGEERITLSDFLTFPISIYQVPLQIVILGLLLAALVSIPILVSILYRFFACIPFLLVVAFLAVMPWLAITLAGSCLLASVRPFRCSAWSS
jgi:ABC-type sugar transport system permease subunit